MKQSTNVDKMPAAGVSCLLFSCFISGPAFGETCTCESPCNKSTTCPHGCWASCEERANHSYCAKGCVSDVPEMKINKSLNVQSRLKSVDSKMPRERIQPVLEGLFGIKSTSSLAGSEGDKVEVSIINSDFNGVLRELKSKGVVLEIDNLQPAVPPKVQAEGAEEPDVDGSTPGSPPPMLNPAST